jgi:quinol monooxygenase YgiN
MAGVGEWTVVLRFRVPAGEVDDFLASATKAARLLAGSDGCGGVEVGRASDDPTLWMLCSRWWSVGDYRRALSSYQVKLDAVPFFAGAIDEPTAFEVLLAVDAEGERAASGDLASDAQWVDRSR